MKLMTKEIEAALPKLYAQENVADPVVVLKFFQPWGSWTWYAYEGQLEPDGDWMFFGLVKGLEEELGYFSLNELKSVKGPFGLGIERDLHFRPVPLSKIKSGEVR